MSGFVAWCAAGPLTTDSAVTEPQEDVWFHFGRTEKEATYNLLNSLKIEDMTKMG
jgi:hypothetical protein